MTKKKSKGAKRKKPKKRCPICGKIFTMTSKESYERFEKKRTYCSKTCKGKGISKENLAKFQRAGGEASRGKPSWNKGLKCPQISKGKTGTRHSEESKRKMSESHKGLLAGEKNPNWSPKFKVPCMNCGKTLLRTKYRLTIKGRKLHFCSTRCQILYQYKRGDFPKQYNTGIERAVRSELVKRGYKEGKDFIHQFKLEDKFMCDFCFPDQKVIVECYGDWHHVNPKKFKGKKLHAIQKKQKTKDKSKEGYIRAIDNRSWTLVILWGMDIKKDVKACVDRIEDALKKGKK